MDLNRIRDLLRSDNKQSYSDRKKSKIRFKCDRCKKRFFLSPDLYASMLQTMDGDTLCSNCFFIEPITWKSNRPRKNSGINASYFPSSTPSKNGVQKRQRRFR